MSHRTRHAPLPAGTTLVVLAVDESGDETIGAVDGHTAADVVAAQGLAERDAARYTETDEPALTLHWTRLDAATWLGESRDLDTHFYRVEATGPDTGPDTGRGAGSSGRDNAAG